VRALRIAEHAGEANDGARGAPRYGAAVAWRTVWLPQEPTNMSPGGASEIRQLVQLPQGQLTHAVCRAGNVAAGAVLPERYEAFYVLAGEGEIWRATADGHESVTALRPGRGVEIPAGTTFQYRAYADASVVFLVVVTPMWDRDHYVDRPEAGPWASEAPPSGASAGLVTSDWGVRDLDALAVITAPDGSEVRELALDAAGSVVHCRLPAGQSSVAVRHRTVHEIWFATGGAGEFWRAADDGTEETVLLHHGVALDIPPGTDFQFRATGAGPFEAVLLTMPPWPGAAEAEPARRRRW
jgi:mannose-6-phosphate isomerase-like protein (cupin superfamily)